ncbi:MAG TPA: molybdopterin-dependent oxidoreductase [Lentimicrobium sp.]|nr:molybdopterin-dependent oxidoreductase [Lentimicrobium sp.]
MQPEPQITQQELNGNKVTETQFHTICNLCSVGCRLKLSYDSSKAVTDISGESGLINSEGEFCSYPANGYRKVTKLNRIIEPLIRKNGQLVPVSWEEALDRLYKEVEEGDPSEKAFFAGARLTNEEQYLIMKICRGCAKSNNIGSFHYFGRGTGYTKLSRANIPFAELIESQKIIIIGAEVKRDNPVVGDFIFKDRKDYKIPVSLITDSRSSDLIHYTDEQLFLKSYYHFVKAVNFYIVSKGYEDKQYISNLIDNFEKYKSSLLANDYSSLVKSSGVSEDTIAKFAEDYKNEPHAVIVFSEKELSGHTCGEIFNLALLTGKHGRTGAGLMLLKENNNSHGLHDMGVMWNLGPGAVPWDDPFQRSTVQFIWGSKDLPIDKFHAFQKMQNSGYEKIFIFGEDPIGCAIDDERITELLLKSRFIMVQDYFLTPTAQLASLVLPASLPYETGGTFTNSQRVIQKVDKRINSPLEFDSWKQLEEILAKYGYGRFDTIDDVTFEIASLLPKFCTSSKLLFRITDEDNLNPLFKFGCNALFREAQQS